jgi:outer membrane protein assembly factor BamE (lipoprotein component of BamABCDE complex)
VTTTRLALVFSALLLVPLLVTACTSVQPGTPMDDVHKLSPGMLADEALERLGSPQDTTTEADGSETWTYRYSEAGAEVGGEAVLLVHVRNGRVATWQERLGD